MTLLRVGIDLGGTKIESVALTPSGGEMGRYRTASPQNDYGQTLDALAAHVDHMRQIAADGFSVGIGIPGAIDPSSGLVKNGNSTWINGHPLDKDLEVKIGLPVRVCNDANCFALSEATDGAAAGAATVLGIIIGTGCGSGIAVHGKPLIGPNAIAGEWGHNALPWPNQDELPGPACFCGLTGCIETWISGTGFTQRFREQTGRKFTSEEICIAAEKGDREAINALDCYEDRFARAISTSINILDPDVIVLGGGMSNIDRLYKNIPPLLTRHVMSPTLSTKLVQNKHGDSSGVRGAAWLWPLETSS